MIAGVTPASPARMLGSRKQSSDGEQPIFSRGPTMDGHGNTLPSSHGLPVADDTERHAALGNTPAAAAAAAAAPPPAAAVGELESETDADLAPGGNRQSADVLTVHAAAPDHSEGSSMQQQLSQPTRADGSAFQLDATAQLAATQPGQSDAEAKPPGVAHLPQGILRRSRSWAATMPQEAGSSGSAALTLRSMPWPPEATTPAKSGHVDSHMAAPQQLQPPSNGIAAGPHLRRASAPVSNPPSPTKQRRRGLFR